MIFNSATHSLTHFALILIRGWCLVGGDINTFTRFKRWHIRNSIVNGHTFTCWSRECDNVFLELPYKHSTTPLLGNTIFRHIKHVSFDIISKCRKCFDYFILKIPVCCRYDVWNVLNDEELRPEYFYKAHILPEQEVSVVVDTKTLSFLREPLARRATNYDIYTTMSFKELIRVKLTYVGIIHCRADMVFFVGFCDVLVEFNGKSYIKAGLFKSKRQPANTSK